MKNFRTISTRLSLVALCAMALAACNLDLTNPNSPTEEQVLSSTQGVVALAVGLQGEFASSIDDYVMPSALITDEWGTKSRALTCYIALMNTSNFDNTCDDVTLPYSNTYQIVRTANTLLGAITPVGFGGGFAAGLSAEAKLFKAMALGYASTIYENLPVNADPAGATPRPRAEVMDTVLELLNSARADLASFPESDVGFVSFKTQVMGTNIDLRNTIDAMITRYSLFRGLYQAASDAAGRVSPTVLSSLSYPSPATNPIYNLAYGLVYIGGLNSFVTQAQPGDKRPGYWLKTTPSFGGNPPDTLLVDFKKYSNRDELFPLYLPDEMTLIRAEAAARLGNLATARTLINQVRTQTTSSVDEPVAGLPALTDAQLPDLTAILNEIAYERRYELYAQGLRWEDTRRLGSQGNTVTFQFLPLPASECRSNPNASAFCT